MTLEDMAIDVRETIAMWVREGLSVAEMCDALSVPPPLGSEDAIAYVHRACVRRWQEMEIRP